MTGRKSSNLSRTLKLMASFGIVALEKDTKNVRLVVKATSFKIEFGLKQAFVEKRNPWKTISGITQMVRGG